MATQQNPYNVWGTPSARRGESAPSIYGALPVSESPAPTTDNLVFTFTRLNPSIANCTVLGPNKSPVYEIYSDPMMPGYTVLKTVADGASFGLIEWKPEAGNTRVEIRGVVPKTLVGTFLRLSDGQRFRIMNVANRDYLWIPDNDAFAMYQAGDRSSTRLALLRSSSQGFKLELSNSAAQAGLIQPAILAAVLLRCGFRI